MLIISFVYSLHFAYKRFKQKTVVVMDEQNLLTIMPTSAKKQPEK